MIWIVFIVGGVLAALAGLLMTGRLGSVAAAQGEGMIFTVFAAAVIGGVSMDGGKGTLFGALCGVIVLGLINNILTLAGVSAQWIQAIYGADHPGRPDARPADHRARPRTEVGARGASTDEAIDKIKEMIVSGELGPGDRLPKEADLAERLGLSRNSLREAVKALSIIRVLDVRQGDGTYVTSLAPELLLDALSFVVDFHRDDTVLQFLEVRRILEPAATALAARRMTDADIAKLQRGARRARRDAGVEALVANDLEFHRRIAAGSGNAGALLADRRPVRADHPGPDLARADPGGRGRTRPASSTSAIVDAIAAREPELARSWATVHIAGVEEWLRQAL